MNLKNKKILITGGTGFIGAAITNKLIDQHCFINIISYPKDSIWRIEDNTKCEIFNLDICNASDLESIIKKIEPEIIFHLAGYTNPERELDAIDKSLLVNFIGLKNLLISLHKYDYELFINTGTSDEYGFQKAPFIETYRENPVSPYSVSKVASTYLCQMMANIYDKPIITVRPFLPYGPKQISRSLIPWLIYSAIEKKKIELTPCGQTRDFIFINDLADAYISLAKNANLVKNMGIFNIGSGKETPIIEIVDLIRNKFNRTKFKIGGKPYRPGEAMHHYSSIEKINKVIGWTPKWTIDEGMSTTLEWWENNRDLWINYRYIWE